MAEAEVRCDIRCEKCNRLLCKGCVRWLEIKCPRCGSIQNVCSVSKDILSSPLEEMEGA